MGERARHRRLLGAIGTGVLTVAMVACTSEPSMPDFGAMEADEVGCLVAYGEERLEVGPLGSGDIQTVEPDPLVTIRFGRTASDLIINADRERRGSTPQVPIADLPTDGPGERFVLWAYQDSGNPGLVVRCWRGG